MSEQTPNNLQCWSWAFGAADRPQEQITIAYGRYCKRFGQVPTVVQVHPGLLVDGLQAPVGLTVRVNDHMPERAFYFVVGGAS